MIDLGKAYSLSDLIDAAHEAEQKIFKCQVWYRGHAICNWVLKPSAHRRHPVLESQFAQHFRLRAPSIADCPDHTDYVSWLPLMQHYGLPTRLLDWTESLLVAAFFALSESKDEFESTIFMLAPGKLNNLSIGYVIPFLADERVMPFIKDAFSVENKDRNQHTVAVLAPRKDRRMAAQLGNYTIHGSREPLEFLSNSSDFLARINIPPSARDKINLDLSVSGMKRSSLFPDLANLSIEISELKAIGLNGEDLEEQKKN